MTDTKNVLLQIKITAEIKEVSLCCVGLFVGWFFFFPKATDAAFRLKLVNDRPSVYEFFKLNLYKMSYRVAEAI